MWVHSLASSKSSRSTGGVKLRFRRREDETVTETEKIVFGEGAVPLSLSNDERHCTLSEPPFRGLGTGEL